MDKTIDVKSCHCDLPDKFYSVDKEFYCSVCNKLLSKISITNEAQAEELRERIEKKVQKPIKLHVVQMDFRFLLFNESTPYFDFCSPILNINWGQWMLDYIELKNELDELAKKWRELCT